MDRPGMSVFLGGESIHIDNAAQTLQEEEAAEDQRRRHFELHEQLQNAFDDLNFDDDDDDDNSINDSSKYTSLNVTRHRFEENLKTIDNKESFENLQEELSNAISKKLHHENDADYINLPSCSKQTRNVNSNENVKYIRNSPYIDKVDLQNEEKYRGDKLKSTIRGYSDTAKSNPNTKSNINDQQLQMLYEVRVREVQRLSEELKSCRRDATAAHDALYGRLVIANTERERTELSLQQAQEIIENNKHHITELEHKITSLTNKIDTLQSHNEELKVEVSATAASLRDAQNRLQAEKLNNNNAYATDALFRSQQDRFREDIDKLEKELMKTKNKLLEKDNELLALEKRYVDMERLKEDLLVEKGTTINKLAIELEEAQIRLTNHDYIELKDKISHLTVERNTAKLQVKDLANKLEATATELVETRGKLSKKQEEMTKLESTIEQLVNERESDSFVQLKTSKSGKEFSSQTDKVDILRNELAKSVSVQKLRKEQIGKLNKSLQKKDEQIENLKSSEQKLMKEIKEYREKESKYLADVKYLTNQVEFLKSSTNNDLLESLKSRCNDLEVELCKKQSELNMTYFKCNQLETKSEGNISDNERYKSHENIAYIDLIKNHEKLTFQFQDASIQLNEFKKLYIEACVSKDKLSKEIDELKSGDLYKSLEEERANVTELLNQLKNEKLKVDDLGNKLLNQQLETFQKELNKLKRSDSQLEVAAAEMEDNKKNIEKLKEENLKLKNMNEEQNSYISSLINELEQSKQLIDHLNSEIELQGQREALIIELKEKAVQMEQFILEQKERMANKKNASTSPKPVEEIDKRSLIIGKTDEMERLKLENIIREDIARHFSMKSKDIEISYNKKYEDAKKQFNADLIELTKVVKEKTEEVRTLQNLIIIERTKFQETLSKLNNETNKELVHDECKKQICHYQNNIAMLSSEVNRLTIELKTNPELKEIQKKFVATLKILEKLKEKYKNVKKIASKYKEYINEKDKHVNSEIERIKGVYEDSLKKMQDRLDNYIIQKEQNTNL